MALALFPVCGLWAGEKANPLPGYLKERFGLVLPASIQIEHVHSTDGMDPYDGRAPVRQTFAALALSPSGALIFKQILILKSWPANRRLLWQDQSSELAIGFLPGPSKTPDAIKSWWNIGDGSGALFYLSDFKQVDETHSVELGAVIIYLTEKTGHLTLWTYERNPGGEKEQVRKPVP